MKQSLIEFYLEWLETNLTKRDFALKHGLRVKELNDLLRIGKEMHVAQKDS